MKTSAVRILQEFLKTKGLYTGKIDGDRGPKTHAAAAALINQRKAELDGDPAGWSDKRKAVAAYQLHIKDEGIDVGDVDGLWGPQTEFAHDALEQKREFGAPILFRDIEPGRGNPNDWPVDDTPGQTGMRAFYGPNGVKGGFTPPMKTVICPWTLRLSWDLSQKTKRIGAHERVADSLQRVLDAVFNKYGEDKIKDLRLDIYGGCYAPRKKRGGSTWSTHAWAIALDFDPDRNQLNWGRDKASFARPEYDDWWDCWEAEGWVSLGRERNFDWMHVQAAKLKT